MKYIKNSLKEKEKEEKLIRKIEKEKNKLKKITPTRINELTKLA